MRIQSLQRSAKSRLPVYLVILLIAMGNFIPLSGHSGSPVSAPTKVATTISINGTINSTGTETAWAPGVPVGTLPNNCTEFLGTAPDVTFFALNDGVNLYLAFDIPDTTPNANDKLFLAFDPNHGAGASPAADDLGFLLAFNNTAASNSDPGVEVYSGAGWTAAPATVLPPNVLAKYSRITAGAGKWQVEMRFPFTGSPLGFSYLYLNETGVGVDCEPDGFDDDFYAKYPPALSIPNNINLPAQFPPPSAWGDLNFGPQPPTVRFQPPLCCGSSDITFTPTTQPFTAGVPVNINATVHNIHTSSTANNVNVEIRVHNFGTGGGVIAPFPLANQVPSIAPMGVGSGTPVTWPSPPAGLHGCIQAEIKPPTVSQYFITPGIAQHNIDVACVAPGERRALPFVTFNPQDGQEGVNIILAKQVLVPRGFRGLTFDIKQPNRPLRAREEFPIQMTVTAAADTPLTDVPTQMVQVPATAGGTASPPLHERTGTESVLIPVKAGDRMHLAATGETDIDGGGPIPASGPDGQDVANSIPEGRRFLLRSESASQFGGALIGSFDNFASSFVVGKEGTVTIPNEIKELRLAVNDFDGGFGDNSGKGFEVMVSTLPAFNRKADTRPEAMAAPATPTAAEAEADVTLPQITLTATSRSRVNVGQASYNLLTNHGGATYQLLVVRGGTGGHEGSGYPLGLSKPVFYGLLVLLLIILLFILSRVFRRKKRAS